jgi:hypothetical protein
MIGFKAPASSRQPLELLSGAGPPRLWSGTTLGGAIALAAQRSKSYFARSAVTTWGAGFAPSTGLLAGLK